MLYDNMRTMAHVRVNENDHSLAYISFLLDVSDLLPCEGCNLMSWVLGQQVKHHRDKEVTHHLPTLLSQQSGRGKTKVRMYFDTLYSVNSNHNYLCIMHNLQARPRWHVSEYRSNQVGCEKIIMRLTMLQWCTACIQQYHSSLPKLVCNDCGYGVTAFKVIGSSICIRGMRVSKRSCVSRKALRAAARECSMGCSRFLSS